MENAEASRTNSQQHPMTANERAAKQAFIDEMLGTWKPASQAEDADGSSKAEMTVGIDATWTIDRMKS